MRRAVLKRLQQLIEDLEAEGHLIGVTRDGLGYYIGMPEGPTPDLCSRVRLAEACHADPELDAALLPFLLKHRPYALLERQALERRI